MTSIAVPDAVTSPEISRRNIARNRSEATALETTRAAHAVAPEPDDP